MALNPPCFFNLLVIQLLKYFVVASVIEMNSTEGII